MICRISIFQFDKTASTYELVIQAALDVSALSIETDFLRSITWSIVGASPLAPPATDPIPEVLRIPVG
tara:strand:+ start:535 stop:738 length:204 start_codon:yes stop_codon:yes gene_type:complete